MKKRTYGWRPDKPDHRDYLYTVPRRIAKAALPKKVDLTAGCPVVYDQGQLGSCTGNAIAGGYEFDQLKQGLTDFMPSRLFIYYNERALEGTVREDAGAEIRDGIKTIAKQGVCTEKTWPYLISKFATKPPKKAYTEGLKHQAIQYQRLDNTDINQLKGCLAEGYPVVFGFSVYESFESDTVAETGKVNLPKKSEQLLGGHAVLLVGYNDSTKRWLVRNSWGTEWGLKGYFTMPYSYLTNTNLADDFWTIRVVEG